MTLAVRSKCQVCYHSNRRLPITAINGIDMIVYRNQILLHLIFHGLDDKPLGQFTLNVRAYKLIQHIPIITRYIMLQYW